jgi:hypothetical protein
MNETGAGPQWLRNNPHRLDLIQVALRRRSATATPLTTADINSGSGATQRLDPWTGGLESNFTVGAKSHAVRTHTACAMDLDLLSWRIESDLVGGAPTSDDDALVVRVAFPYGSPLHTGADWGSQSAHTTSFTRTDATSARFHRTLDHDEYEVVCRWSPGFSMAADTAAPHAFVLSHDGATESSVLELSCLLAPLDARFPIAADSPWLLSKASATRAHLANGGAGLPLFDEVATAAAVGWEQFWKSGAFVDLGGDGSAADPRATELERRVVLSQYITRSQSAGATPPQETGYTLLSWGGKHHHEMRWFHQAHFAMWMRPELLQRSDDWFSEMLPNATAYATFQGYAGARWPKMVGPATTARELAPGVKWQGNCFDAPSVGRNTTYAHDEYPLLYVAPYVSLCLCVFV